MRNRCPIPGLLELSPAHHPMGQPHAVPAVALIIPSTCCLQYAMGCAVLNYNGPKVILGAEMNLQGLPKEYNTVSPYTRIRVRLIGCLISCVT